ncbi:5'/3'-nucleotidase SurE [Kitasatospora sp. CMC57]|uniref:5'-nucleotidase n=1 Tax=Kitasatospora sp. CMC57 TaxID=3231513 RepID=A0AB33K286_9ACTN
MAHQRLTRPPRILVTNDDGIDSEGLRQLALVARRLSPQVTVAAPAEEASGSSAALTAVEEHGRIVVTERRLAGLSDVSAQGVEALPGFIAMVGCQGAFGSRPDLVLSGINNGANTGHAITHSGTVGAAVTAGVNGCRALAVSLDTGGPPRWGTAARLAALVLPLLLETGPGTVFNLNVPNLWPDGVRGVRRAGLAAFGAVQTTLTQRGRGYIQLAVSETVADPDLRTDAGLLAHDYAALTVLRPVSAAPWPDGLAPRVTALVMPGAPAPDSVPEQVPGAAVPSG